MIQRVFEQASKSHAKQVFVATDDQRIADAVNNFGGEAILTSPDHASGTDRIQEAVALVGLGDAEVVVNVQGDEPLIAPGLINQVAAYLADPEVNLATLKAPITQAAEVFDPNIVKVVTDRQGWALYFSRAPVPYSRSGWGEEPLPGTWFRHLGIYAYSVASLQQFVAWPTAELETTEALEQLRVLANGGKIFVGEANQATPAGIDTPEDVARTLEFLDAG